MKEIIIKYFIPPNEQEDNANMDHNQNMPESIHIGSVLIFYFPLTL